VDAYLTIANLPLGPQKLKTNTRRKHYKTIVTRTLIRRKLQQHYKTSL